MAQVTNDIASDHAAKVDAVRPLQTYVKVSLTGLADGLTSVAEGSVFAETKTEERVWKSQEGACLGHETLKTSVS